MSRRELPAASRPGRLAVITGLGVAASIVTVMQGPRAAFDFHELLCGLSWSRGAAGIVAECPVKPRIEERLPDSIAAQKAAQKEVREFTGEYSEKGFWEVVRRGDDYLTRRYLDGGMTIGAVGLHEVLSDRTLVRRAPLPRLLEFASNRNQEFCSSDDHDGPGKAVPAHRTVRRFADYAKDAAALKFVLEFCRGTDFAAPLSLHLAAEKRQIEAQKADVSKRLAFCTTRLWERAFRDKIVKHNLACPDEAFGSGIERDLCRMVAEDVRRERGPSAIPVTGLDVEKTYIDRTCQNFSGQIDETVMNNLVAAVSKYRR